MARWKALPEGLDPAVVQLVVRLRRMKDDSRLSLDQLAVRTGYSASSWERYLGGRLLPPREAAQALAGLVGADRVRLLVLYEAAADAWHQGPPAPGAEPAATAPEVDEVDDGEPPAPERSPRRRLRYALTAVAAAAAGAAIALLAVQPAQSAQTCSPARQAVAAAAPSPSPVHYTCTFTRRNGLWYAGNSTTSTADLVVTMSGSEVAELQCLLQRAGVTPGGIDGSYGPLTEQAVIEEQQQQHLVVDGRVGPQTWKALRR